MQRPTLRSRSTGEVAANLLLLAAIFQLSDAARHFACALRGYKVTRVPMMIHILAFYGVALPVGFRALGLALTGCLGIQQNR